MKPTAPCHRRRAVVASTLLLPFAARAQSWIDRGLDVPYVPTPMPVVRKMLAFARVQRGDTLYDLGCGDGRIVVEAARRYGVRGVGIDLDPDRIAEAKENARREGVADRVQFRNDDLFKTDLSAARVVTLYLLPEVNLRLRPQLWRQLAPGARVVSHAFPMGDDWPPEQHARVGSATVFAWTITPQLKSAARADARLRGEA